MFTRAFRTMAGLALAASATTTGASDRVVTVSGELFECEVKVSRANVRDAAQGVVISTLPRGSVAYLWRRITVGGAAWHEMLQFDPETQKHTWLGVMAASTLTCWGVPERIPNDESGMRELSF